MNINFKKVIIENFQSIATAEVDLLKQGIILIKGENHYEKNSLSNGSGKSSVMESILWCLYGKTSSGITDPTNRYGDDGCAVTIILYIDAQEYTIIRSIKHSQYKTGLLIYKDHLDISDRIKTDTEKILKNILPMNMDIFLSTIFLSQGFNNRFSNLSPTERKERIEELTETSKQLEEFKNLISKIKDKYNNKVILTKTDIAYNNGSYNNVEKQLNDILEEINNQPDKPDFNIIDLKQKLKILEEMETDINSKLTSNQDELYNLRNQINLLTNEVGTNKLIIEKNNSLLSKMNEPEKVCPTCHQKITDEFADTLVESYKNELDKAKDIIDIKNKLLLENNNLISTIQVKNDNLKEQLNNNKKEINNLKEKLELVYNYKDITNEKKKVETLNLQLTDLYNKTEKLKEDMQEYENLTAVANHIMILIAKQFRSYLLDTTIKFMNSKLKDYSKMLFSNDSDIIEIVIDQSKINIFLGDSIYESLSGGEKRKVDLATMFTQRDLSLNIAGTSANLLIFDEIFDNLDETAITIVLDMFLNLSSEIDSMFIISHKPQVEIPYDNLITVIKSEDRKAHLIFS